ncbi:hypothetical protein ACS0TY_003516 [Phlomoides rotata]
MIWIWVIKFRKSLLLTSNRRIKLSNVFRPFVGKNNFSGYTLNPFSSAFKKKNNRMMYCQVIPSKEVSNEIGVDVIKVLERSIVNNYFWKEYTYTVCWREIGEHISCNCRKFEFRGILCCHIMLVLAQKNIQIVNERYVLRRWRKYVNRRHSNIFFAGGYSHMTEEYKKFQEVEKFFQQCIEIAMCSLEKLEFIKERCNEMKDALVNWVPTISDNVPPSQTTENTQVGGGTPILNPIVTTTRGRPRSNRYISRVEERSRGHVRRNYTEDDDIEGSGEGQGRGHRRRACGRGVGRGRGQGRVGGRGSNGHGDGMVTQGNEGA